MADVILDQLRDVITSPWAYLLIFVIAAIDGFLPLVPSESAVIIAGVFAAEGDPNLFLVIAVAAAGAILGDHISYFIGRWSEHRLDRWLKPGTRRRATFDWAGRQLTARGGLILVVARYIPGGRTAVTLTMGATGYPRRSFTFFATLAGLSWGIYSALVGYIGGKAFEENPLKGVVFALSLAISITVLTELIRFLRNRRKRRAAPQAAEPQRELVGSGVSQEG